MCMLISLVYREDPDLKRNFRFLRRFQVSHHLFGTPILNHINKRKMKTWHNMIYLALPMTKLEISKTVMSFTQTTWILRPKIGIAQYKFKAIGKYSGVVTNDAHLHLKQFLEVASKYKIPWIINYSFRLILFQYYLRDNAKSWLNSLETNSLVTWNGLIEKFLANYFPIVKNSELMNKITSFRQGVD